MAQWLFPASWGTLVATECHSSTRQSAVNGATSGMAAAGWLSCTPYRICTAGSVLMVVICQCSSHDRSHSGTLDPRHICINLRGDSSCNICECRALVYNVVLHCCTVSATSRTLTTTRCQQLVLVCSHHLKRRPDLPPFFSFCPLFHQVICNVMPTQAIAMVWKVYMTPRTLLHGMGWQAWQAWQCAACSALRAVRYCVSHKR